ncbi:hypothetical protein LOD99_6527 [Oopsacas minuta]|uniref:Fibronectin type-III domain-containing protein n=1 Tax=Oopsacas minuta TaxID=111878 RepID=A0AAV7JLA1_9METZ|nr:hypothetical protein LOD99_6527 [Oopsacas minuta]
MFKNSMIFSCSILCFLLQLSTASIFSQVVDLTAVALNSTALNISFSGSVESNVVSYCVTVASDVRNSTDTVQITTNIGVFPNYTRQVLDFGGLFPFTEYTITVIGTTLTSDVLDPAIAIETTEQAVPAAGSLSSVNTINASTIRVSWFAPPELEQNGPITSFIIDFSNIIILGPYTQEFETTESYPISSITGFSNDFIVEEGITYTVSVRAVNGAGIGVASESISATTPVVAPPSVVPFNLSEITNFTLTSTCISFLVPTLTIPFLNGLLLDYTIVYVGTLPSSDFFQSSNSSTILDVTSVDTVSVPAGNNITVCDFLPNYSYQLNVSARNAEGSTLPLTLEVTFPSAAPSGIPLNLSLLVVSYQQIDVSWSIDISTVNGELRSFNIFYYTSSYSNSIVYYVINSTGPYQVTVTGLSPNTLYSVDVSIVNEIAQGDNSLTDMAQTLPRAPDSVILTIPPEIFTTTVQIYIPTQRLFPSANIAVIYIIVDSTNPPVFSTYTNDQRYNSVTTTSDGVILEDGTATIRIHAVLDDSYYNQQTNYLQITVGRGEVFSINSSVFDNIPLLSGTSYQISYYILFYDENQRISPEFTFFESFTATETSIPYVCLACFLIPISVILAIIAVIILVIIAVLIHFLVWKRRGKKEQVNVRVIPNENFSKTNKNSFVIANPDIEAKSTPPPEVYGTSSV